MGGAPANVRLRVRVSDVGRMAERARAVEIVEKAGIEQVNGAAWVAYSDLHWKQKRSPRELLERRGCNSGEEISFRDQYQRIEVFPVACE